MSTQTLTDNAATVASIYEAFGRGDIPFILSNLSDDCHWVAMGKGVSKQGGTYKGKEVVEFFNRLLGEGEFVSFSPVFISNADDNTVVAFGNMSCKARATGKPYVSDWAMRWVFNDDDKVCEYQNYHDTAAFYLASQP
jgi:ketosteroid isomerase-like protein